MIGLILIYFVGKAFYDLAKVHDKNAWGFAILGVASYYGGIFIGGMIIGLLVELFFLPGFIDETSDGESMWLGFAALPIGILTCWGTYHLLKRSLSKPKEVSRQTLDADLISQPADRYNRPGDRYNQNER